MHPTTYTRTDTLCPYTTLFRSLYSISKSYGITSEEIIRLNPDAKDGVKIGKILIIPPVFTNTAINENSKENKSKEFTFHEVKKDETLYSISKQYSISKDEIIRLNPDTKDGLKVGKVLIIPPVYANTTVKDTSVVVINENNNEIVDSALIANIETLFPKNSEPKSEINIALALPFQLTKVTENSKIDGNTDKFLEFYQGILLAIDSLKNKGLSINLYIYDSGKSEAEIIKTLNNPELKNMDILIGPAYTAQIKPMSDFALMNNIKLIIPFSSKADETLLNPNIYQINTPLNQSFEIASEQFAKNFGDKNIILIRFKTAAYDDKAAYSETLISERKSVV